MIPLIIIDRLDIRPTTAKNPYKIILVKSQV